mmetsp:Transcript_7387/g.18319  ORF Transcript_7387/g.18319 Transcript_7387/m.18319 type:complete len:347 (-) Transcript_7387:464-1504(-)
MSILGKCRTVAAVAAVAAAMATKTSVAAFLADTAPSFSSITRPQGAVERVEPSTKLFAANEEGKTKVTIETIDDDNRHILLHPPSAPSRPVLVDAFAPWCGPCKLLDKVLRKAQPDYAGRVDFCRWNVNDKEGTKELKQMFLDSGHTLSKLPSLIVFREGEPVAVRPGFANEFQLDDFLEKTLPDVLERTFDEHGVKMVPLPEMMMVQKEESDKKKISEKKTEGKTPSASSESIPTMLPLPEETMMENDKKNSLENKSKEVTVTSDAEKVEEQKVSASSGSAPPVIVQEAVKHAVFQDEADQSKELDDCTDPVECWQRVEQTLWQNRTVVPAMDGIMLPTRSYGSP